ncbi:MAG TPA: transglycosylase SLT domain-containing protein [Candidatus Sulfotelmatobacter sp.]|nr:transglycosylase SLT domain-containing protein [Candidatus Sulfotelmatobacter sp.]
MGLKLWCVLVLGALCAPLGVDAASLYPQQTSTPSASDSQDKPAATPNKPAAEQKDSPDQVSPAKTPVHKAQPKTTTGTKPTAKKAGTQAHTATSKKRKRPLSPRIRRIREAFVASTSLRPMAQQLIQDRSSAAYAGVEGFARAHAQEDAGALSWLVVGYAHVLDHDYAKAIDPLNRAKPRAGDLGDYVAYYLGTCYLQTGRQGEALATLANFATTYPDSLLVRDAHLSYASALLTEGRASEAAEMLEKDRLPARADIELALGRAYEALGQNAKAIEALANVYYNMPTAPEADAANAELKKLPSVPAATPAQRKTRADLLMKARRYNDAADEYRDQLAHAEAEGRAAVTLALADALHRGGRNREARSELTTLPGATPDQGAQRLYILGEIAWALDENENFYRTVDDLRKLAPTSSWLEAALLSVANLHLVHHEYDQALDAFRELQQRFPTGSRASYAHWKAAWLTLRQGRNDDAKKAFDEQIALYPSSNETSAALYWRARLAEEDQQPAMARAYYQKLSDRYRNYYYAELGRQRLQKLPAAAETPGQYTLLDHIPPLDNGQKIVLADPPADDLHLQKAELLGNGGLVDFAVRELQAAASADGGNWGPAETAQLYTDTGHYDRALEVMKRNVPSYFAVEIPTLPRPYWEALFPRPYWTDLKRFSIANGLDPYLVASLIRQESEFNPVAVSRANAVGLMQLLPRTGKLVAGQEKLKRYAPSQLYTAPVNLQLGTRYFRGMVDKFGGSFAYALAAYNAGSDRVEEWLGQGKYRDEQEFVESIPFTETREYVQAILRNANVYKQLYGAP